MNYIVLLTNGTFRTFGTLEGVKGFILCDESELVDGVFKASEMKFEKISDVTFEEEAA